MLDVAGARSTPLQHETSDPVQPDDGMFSGSTDFTYTLEETPA